MSKTFECDNCDWTGDESELMVTFEHTPVEFWGMCSTVSTEVPRCPACGSEEVFEVRDDGDFDPTAEDEENPYTMSAPNVRAPARQV